MHDSNRSRPASSWLFCCAVGLGVLGCSDGESRSDDLAATGGRASTGGRHTGGEEANAGEDGGGSDPDDGGSGGTPSGGAQTGGVQTGGVQTGGRATGGGPASGGATGGAATTGGSSGSDNSGGLPASGGDAGGDDPGGTGAGGALPPTGGTGGGGALTGGALTGGAPTGGAPLGGAPSGGSGTGGSDDPQPPDWICGSVDAPEYCVPGAACNAETGWCECRAGWEGPGWACLPTAPCADDPCLNGGTCHAAGTQAICTCPLGFGGRRCEIDCSGNIDFPDPVLAAAVRREAMLADGEPITAEALADVHSLGVYEGTIGDFTGLACMTALSWVWMDEVGLTDLTPFAALPWLRELDAPCNPVTDLAPLESVVNLTSLSLGQYSHCELPGGVSDLSPLSAHTGLHSLDLDGHEVESLAPLAALTHLEFLVLDGNAPLTSLAGIEGATRLEYLVVSDTAITSLAPLAELRRLGTLYAYGTGVTDLTPLAGHPTLTDLYLSDTPVADLGPLVDATALQYVDVARTQVTDLGPLVQNPGIGQNDWVMVDGTPLDCAAAAADLATLTDRGVNVYSDCE